MAEYLRFNTIGRLCCVYCNGDGFVRKLHDSDKTGFTRSFITGWSWKTGLQQLAVNVCHFIVGDYSNTTETAGFS